jgi:hypothetical protein
VLFRSIWNPIYIKELILIDSIFEDKIKYKTYWEGDNDYEDSNFDESEFNVEE